MAFSLQDLVSILTVSTVVIGLFLNWQRDRGNNQKIKRDQLLEDYNRVCAEREQLRVQLSEAQRLCAEQEARYKTRLDAKDETIMNLSRKFSGVSNV